MRKYTLDWKKYTLLARSAIAEGTVLLRNENETLPIKPGTTISIFGRNQFDYYRSGTGSGGMVNATNVIKPLEAIKSCDDVQINFSVLHTYEEWLKENPYDKGEGWAGEPWSQKEMPLSDKFISEAAANSDMAIIMLGRTAGEDRDNTADSGSYLLTDIEKYMIAKVCKAFAKTAVILNVGNIIDMQWAVDYHPSAILYAWQGGMEGGNGLLDILTGKVAPSGKLTDTIAKSIFDYPSTNNFGHEDKATYQEDIYVGYRYFETFAKDKVLYPFGFGLTYTTFTTEVVEVSESDGIITLSVSVANTGTVSGKEVVQIYVEKPQGLLGNPARSLISFAKTKQIDPGTKEILEFSISVIDFASYDDGGVTGYKSCYVLEAGAYQIYAGTDVRKAALCFKYNVETQRMVLRLTENIAPVTSFTRMKPIASEIGYTLTYEDVPLRTVDIRKRCLAELPESRKYTGDHGYKLADVFNKKVSLETFLDQLTDEDIACMIRGEGMCSPKVAPGTAAAFGGVSDRLQAFGIPAACCADGPSGIRLDCGNTAFSLPNGTLFACTFNLELIEELYDMVGLELRKNRIDTLLGPGINIHRNPLNGRNFEYFSEDPYLTGKMAAVQLKGMHRVGVTGTLKHFSANNQESHRNKLNSIVSERALREIYLKGFEIAVKEAGAYSIMTSYGAINGIWTAGLYDQDTRILRGEWGFEGIVMTDWWANINDEGGSPSKNNTGPMVRAQNDLYMVVSQPTTNPFEDNTLSCLADGSLIRGELLRNAANICRFIMRSPVMERTLGLNDGLIDEIGLEINVGKDFDYDVMYHHVSDGDCLNLENIDKPTSSQFVYAVALDKPGTYEVSITIRSSANELAHIPITLFLNNIPVTTFIFNGTNGEWAKLSNYVFFFNQYSYLKLDFELGCLQPKEIKFVLVEPFSMNNNSPS
jgi:beta-glucosidase